MISDVDYSILATKIEALEHRIKKLEDSVVVLNAYADTQLKNKYYPYQSDNPEAPYYREPFISYNDILAVL